MKMRLLYVLGPCVPSNIVSWDIRLPIPLTLSEEGIFHLLTPDQIPQETISLGMQG